MGGSYGCICNTFVSKCGLSVYGIGEVKDERGADEVRRRGTAVRRVDGSQGQGGQEVPMRLQGQRGGTKHIHTAIALENGKNEM